MDYLRGPRVIRGCTQRGVEWVSVRGKDVRMEGRSGVKCWLVNGGRGCEPWDPGSLSVN